MLKNSVCFGVVLAMALSSLEAYSSEEAKTLSSAAVLTSAAADKSNTLSSAAVSTSAAADKSNTPSSAAVSTSAAADKSNTPSLTTDLTSALSTSEDAIAPQPMQRLVVAKIKKKKAAAVHKPLGINSALGLSEKSKIKFNGFLSAGASMSNAPDGVHYNVPGHGAISNKVGFAPSSLVGLQVTAQLTKWADVVSQFVASGDGTNGNTPYSLNAGWAFLRLTLSPEVQLHLGRFRLPLFLYSSTQQVGYSYPWQYLPGEVYRIVPFDNLNGLSFIFSKTLGDTGWSLNLQPFFGENKSQYSVNPDTLVDFAENNILGARMSIGNNNFTLRGAYARLDLSGQDSGGQSVVSAKNSYFWSVGAKLNISKLFVAGEFASRDLSDKLAALQGYYATAGLRLDKWMPALTYAHLNTTNSPSVEKKEKQTSYTFSLDYYINASLVAKSNVSYVMPEGTFGLFDKDPNKKAVFVYGAELDAVF